MKNPHNVRRGQTLLMFSMTSVTIFGLMGLVVDLGWSHFRKQAAQAAAQAASSAATAAAALSGGSAISCSTMNVVCQAETNCPETILNGGVTNIDKGCLYAKENGFITSGRQKVTIAAGTSTPPTGNGAIPRYWVTVRVSETLPQLFSRVLGFSTGTITARSTSGYFPPALGGCIYILNSFSQAMQLNGNITFTTGCGININSNYYAALKLVGSASVAATGSSQIKIVGGYVADANSILTPMPINGAPTFRDPMGDVPPPAVGACDSTGVSTSNNEQRTVTPGVYCGAITVTGHSVLTLSPGLYIIKSGGISVGGQATLKGAGVTIYVQSGSVGFAGGATSNLTAPTSGPWQGLLFYQDQANTSSASLVGGSDQLMSGVLYFPTTHLDYNAGSTTTAQQATIICDTLNVTGNSYIAASGNSPFMTLFSGIGVLE